MNMRVLCASLCIVGLLYCVYVVYSKFPQYELVVTHSREEIDYENGFSDQMHLGLARYISERWLVPPAQNPLRLDEPTRTDFSQVRQSVFVDEFLRQRREGFFVECGAASGELLSNTLFFERERGWTGLLIEANPALFDQLLHKNRNAYIVNACLSTTNVTGRQTFYPQDLYGGLNETEGASAITVQCFPLYPLLLATGRTYVDYFSLDVEGAELPILRHIPFHHVFIDVIGVEYRINYPGPAGTGGCDHRRTMEKLLEIREFFASLGVYREIGILPWGSHYNKPKREDQGLDVYFKHI